MKGRTQLASLVGLVVLGLLTLLLSPRAGADLALNTLYSFSGVDVSNANSDGACPAAGLVLGVDGNIYGTTGYGGVYGHGAVFKITPSGAMTTLYAFGAQSGDGAYPMACLIQARDGNFYGSTEVGGANGAGSIFMITPSGALTTLYSFSALNAQYANTDGVNPQASLVQTSDGTFYGTTYAGGPHVNGGGTVFKFTTDGTAAGTVLATLHSFVWSDGACLDGGLVLGSDFNFYGTTQAGGANNAGTIFKITPSGALTTLYQFSGGADGMYPEASLVLGSDGNYYGTTNIGGAYSQGTVFKMTTDGTASGTILTTLYSFGAQIGDGAYPQSCLVQAGNGDFYATTTSGGASNRGAIFEITPLGTLTTLYSFSALNAQNENADGTSPLAGLVLAGSGAFYGVAQRGGASGTGTIFHLAPSTTTTLDSSPNPSACGAPVTFAATIAPIVPDGETVTFYDGATPIGTGLIAGSVASLTISTLSVGPHSITASYPGDVSNAPSGTNALTQNVYALVATTTKIASSLPSSNYCVPVTFTATVTPGVPNGETVSFYDNAVSIGTGTTSGGKATLTTSSLAVGSHGITAIYPGDATYGTSTSSVLTQTVAVCHPTTTLTSSCNPSTCGAPGVFTATVSPSVPDGETVNFYDGVTSKALIGSGTTSGSVATLPLCGLAAGSHTIWADYIGDANHAYSWSNSLAQTVNKISTTISLNSSNNPSSFGQSITFAASVLPMAPSNEIVTFYDGATSIGTGKITGSMTATLTISSLAVGSHGITARYPGDTTNAASTSLVWTQTVNQGTTTTKVASSLNPSAYGGPVTFNATVSPSVANGETVTFYVDAVSIGTGTTSGGKATLTTSSLSIGSHSITASYPGDATYLGSASAVLTQTVGVCHPTTTLASSLNPSSFGASVTFAATVSPSVPNGETVNFYDGATSKALIGTGTTTGGVATFSTSSLVGGNHTIWADYVGDANYAYSWSSSLAQTVNKAPTTSTVTASLNPSTYGASVTLTATVSPSVPNGETLTFYDGATSLGTGKTSGSKATLAISTLAIGSHSITASYPGDANYAASTSSALTQTVNQGTTTTTVASSLPSSTYGGSVTFTATVTPGVPGGEIVTFYDGGVAIGTGATSGGKATLTTASLAVGSHIIKATYPGDATYGASTSSGLTQAVAICHPATTLASSCNPSTYGGAGVFTATVSPSVPDGETVNFYDGATSKTLIGSGTTSGGVATFPVSGLAAGSHTIWANYVGDANHAYSWSSSLTQTVDKAYSSMFTPYCSVNPSTYGVSLTFIATIVPSVANGETVTFYDGGSLIGTGKTSGGSATLTTAALAVGAHIITTSYPGDANNTSCVSTPWTQTVTQASTTATVTSSKNPSTYGGSVTFTATVSPCVPNGEVLTFYDGGAPIGTGTVSGGKATLATTALSAGSNPIFACYPGDTNLAGCQSSTLTQTVVVCHPTTALASSLNPAPFGSAGVLTATVSPSVPDGETVNFYDGATSKALIGSGTTSGSVATFPLSGLAVGSHTIWAQYTGDTNNAYSWSASLVQTITKCPTTLTWSSSSPNPSTYLDMVTFQAWIAPGPPDGETFTFYDGGTVIGRGINIAGEYVMWSTTTPLAAGSHNITVSYAGDANFAACTSNVLVQVVDPFGTSTYLATSSPGTTYGAAVTFTATVIPTVVNGETVTFYDGGVAIGTGTISEGEVATFTTSTLGVGSHSITAAYSGDANYTSSTSDAVTQTISQGASTTTLASSLSSSIYGAPVTFTATIVPSVANGETVTFYDGGVAIGTGAISGGKATLMTSTLVVGSHIITASYPGDANCTGSTSAALTQTVVVRHPTTTLVSSLNPSTHGTQVTFTATISPTVPDGETVKFYDGATSKALIGSGTTTGGVATFTISTLASGSHTIWADYLGDANIAYSWSSSLMQTVQ